MDFLLNDNNNSSSGSKKRKFVGHVNISNIVVENINKLSDCGTTIYRAYSYSSKKQKLVYIAVKGSDGELVPIQGTRPSEEAKNILKKHIMEKGNRHIFEKSYPSVSYKDLMKFCRDGNLPFEYIGIDNPFLVTEEGMPIIKRNKRQNNNKTTSSSSTGQEHQNDSLRQHNALFPGKTAEERRERRGFRCTVNFYMLNDRYKEIGDFIKEIPGNDPDDRIARVFGKLINKAVKGVDKDNNNFSNEKKEELKTLLNETCFQDYIRFIKETL